MNYPINKRGNQSQAEFTACSVSAHVKQAKENAEPQFSGPSPSGSDTNIHQSKNGHTDCTPFFIPPSSAVRSAVKNLQLVGHPFPATQDWAPLVSLFPLYFTRTIHIVNAISRAKAPLFIKLDGLSRNYKRKLAAVR